MSKVAITIPSLVSLRRTLQRWRWRSRASSTSDAAVPAGHVAVSVQQGAAPRRFVVRVAHLSHPAFLELLRHAEEEYGFPAGPGPIALPCDEDRFLDVLHRVPCSSCCCGLVAAPGPGMAATRGRCCRAWPSRSSSGDRESATAARAAGEGTGISSSSCCCLQGVV